MTYRSPLNILLIDSSPQERATYCRFLQEDNLYTYQIVECGTVTQAIAQCQQALPDIILLNFALLHGNESQFIQILGQLSSHPETAVIILTEPGEEITPHTGINSSHEYLLKTSLSAELLQQAVHRAVARTYIGKQQELIAAIALRIRQSLALDEILGTTAAEVRQFLHVDRVLVYQFQPDMSGKIVAESVVPPWTATLDRQIYDTCWQQGGGGDYRQGKKSAIADIYQAGLSDCHVQMLAQFAVKANLVVPILVQEQLWGLLVAHQCSAPRDWQAVELELLDQLGVQIAIAIHQASIHEQVKAEAAALRATQERLNLTLDFAGIAYWEWNPITKEIFATEQASQSLCLGVSHVNLWLHPEDRQRVEQEWQQAIANHTDYAVEYRVMSADGGDRWVCVKGRGDYDATGELLRMRGVLIDITQRKQIEAELIAITDLQQAILDGIDYAIIYYNANGIQIFNAAAQRMLGYTAAEVVAKFSPGIFHDPTELQQRATQISWQLGEEILPSREFLATFTQNHSTHEGEWTYIRKDGSRFPVLLSVKYLQAQPGGNVGFLSIAKDITEQKQIEKALRDSENRYAILTETAPVAIFRLDTSGGCIYVNDYWSKMTGRPTQAALGMGWLQDLHPEDRHHLLMQWQQGAWKIHQEGRYFDAYGTTIWFYLQILPELNPFGDTISYIGTFTDISERKQAEFALLESERRFATLTKVAPVGIFQLDASGNCVYVNERWSQLTGRSKRSGCGLGWLEAIHPEDRDRLTKRYQKQLQPRELMCEEVRHVLPDGSITWAQCYMLPEHDTSGKIIGYIGTLTDITSHKQTEAQLQHLSEKLTLALQSGRFGIWEYDIAQGKQTWDERMYELYGLSKSDFSPTYEVWLNCLHPDDRSEIVSSIEQVLQGTKEYNVEFRIIHASGEIRFLKGYGILKHNQQGEPVQVIGVNFDISDRKRAEQELIRNRDLREAIFHESADAIFLVDPQTLLTLDCNRRAIELFEATDKTQLININGQTLQRYPLTVKQIDAMMTQFLSKGVWSGELEYVTLRGKVFWGNIAAKSITVAGRTINLVRLTDINDRKQAQEELAKYARAVEDLYNKAPCGYHSLDSEGRFLKVNETELQLLGYTREEMIGQPIVNFLTEPSRQAFAKNYPHFKQQGWIKDLEYEMICKDGTILPVLINATAVKDSNGNYLYNRATLFDMRQQQAVLKERQQAEAELRQTNKQLARATRLKDEFLANMSHELRTPLNAILGMSEGLLEGVFGSINERQAKAIATIERSGRHLLELINDILDLSKIESGKLELQLSDVSVRRLCDSSLAFVKQMALKKKIRLRTQIADNIDSIQVDERRLRQVLINLLSNAVKFTPTGGTVTIAVWLADAAELESKIATGEPSTSPPSAPTLCFQVTDTGIGIAPADIQKLFQPFIQLDSSLNRQYTGTGLGLALVQRIVNLHGGTVSVSSEIGQGSSFVCRIPYLASDHLQKQQLKPVLPRNRRKTQNSHVLIIEDSVPASEQITRYLKELKMQPLVYPQGEGALEEVIRVRPALIILDLQLPHLSGWDVLHQLQHNPQTQEIPVIIISVMDEHTKGLAQGASAYLVKPITRTQLQTTIEKLLYLVHFPEPNPILATEMVLERPIILLAEDNQANIDTISGYLESRGYDLMLANNGQQAIDMVEVKCPDLIIMDIHMPGIDGLAAIRHIREHGQFVDVPIIALTALAMPGDRETCLAAGASEYLTKPVKLKQLVATMQKLLGH